MIRLKGIRNSYQHLISTHTSTWIIRATGEEIQAWNPPLRFTIDIPMYLNRIWYTTYTMCTTYSPHCKQSCTHYVTRKLFTRISPYTIWPSAVTVCILKRPKPLPPPKKIHVIPYVTRSYTTIIYIALRLNRSIRSNRFTLPVHGTRGQF